MHAKRTTAAWSFGLMAGALAGGHALSAERPLAAELPLTSRACWERRYDEAHLAKHPRQQVSRVRLLHLPDDWTSGRKATAFYLLLEINLRKRTGEGRFDWDISAWCRPSGAGLRCTNEYGLGTFRIDRNAGGSLIVRNEGLRLNPSGYSSEDIADNAMRLPAKSDDDAFVLSRTNIDCRIEEN